MHACRAQRDHKRQRTHLHRNQLERVSLNERGESHRSNDSRGSQEVKVSVSDTAISMGATWGDLCTPAGPNRFTLGNVHTCTGTSKDWQFEHFLIELFRQ